MECLEYSGIKGRAITLKFKFADSRQMTRSKILQKYLHRTLNRRRVKAGSFNCLLKGNEENGGFLIPNEVRNLSILVGN
jgi:hypothetical protein